MTFNLRPSEIRYSQDTISSSFSNGTPLTSTFARLISGQESVTDLPEIKCVRRYGDWYAGSRGNRRLFLYKKLEKAGVISTIPVLESYPGRNNYFTAAGSGLSVRCSDPQIEDKIAEIVSQWKRGEDVVARWGTGPVTSGSQGASIGSRRRGEAAGYRWGTAVKSPNPVWSRRSSDSDHDEEGDYSNRDPWD